MNVPAGSVIVSPSCAFVSLIACTFASEPSDGQTVPKALDVIKKDNPVAIKRNFPIFGPFFVGPSLMSSWALTCPRIYSQKRRSPGAGGRLSLRQFSSGRFFYVV